MKKLLCAFLAMALVILAVGGSMVAYAEDAEAPENTVQVKTASYKTADYSGTTGTCYWYIEDGILYFEPQDGVSGVLGSFEDCESPWYEYCDEIEGVEVLEGISAGTDLSYYFFELYWADYIQFADDFDTSSVTSMEYMFDECNSLTELDLSMFDTSSVISMDYMFAECSSLTELDLSMFDTSSVIYMDDMFNDCSSLTELDLSSFDTSSAETMEYMFNGCSSLTELDLSSFDTSSVVYFEYMFYGCSSLTTLDLSSFDLSSLESRWSMFSGCSSLKSIALGESWDWKDQNGSVITSVGDGLLPTKACWSKLESSENGTNTYDSSIGELSSKQLAARWTSDYAGIWVRTGTLKTQKITVKKAQLTKTIHTKKLKKKNQTFKLKASTSGNGKITYKKTSGNKKIKVSKAGKVTVKKGLKKGKTYKVKVKVTAAETSKYMNAAKTVTLKIKIK